MDRLALLRTVLPFLRWLFGLWNSHEQATGAAEERKQANEQNAARLERQNEVAKRPVASDELQKSLRDGTF